jgi:hypothetical protein
MRASYPAALVGDAAGVFGAFPAGFDSEDLDSDGLDSEGFDSEGFDSDDFDSVPAPLDDDPDFSPDRESLR